MIAVWMSGCQSSPSAALSDVPLKVLIVDGQNNHEVWPWATAKIKQELEATGRFSVDVYRSRYTWKGENWLADYGLDDGKTYTAVKEPQTDPEFAPVFADYQVVISNFGWKAAPWPQATREAFEAYMKNGGGLVVFHAADNSFPDWPAFNQMIGLGGWGGRNENSGPYVYFSDAGEQVVDTSPGQGGGHGQQHPFEIQLQNYEHPVVAGLPESFMHAQDELYNRLRGPAQNLTVLATAYDDPAFKGFGRHEPVLMTIDYFDGRVFHSTLGHGKPAIESDSFLQSLIRGTEWAATGTVTLTSTQP
ncbi:ThuA domain-containing protein [Alteromonas aestuariivivens]|uniref:ThuA domain-containing protein n=2 Tax=Alteromonas aestuariivivens TaxID=1938339 RepID=A0A3D8M6J8_9ALTE|nr:ThuA domain-containing protein [Alteromonas aestuariivivens]